MFERQREIIYSVLTPGSIQYTESIQHWMFLLDWLHFVRVSIATLAGVVRNVIIDRGLHSHVKIYQLIIFSSS